MRKSEKSTRVHQKSMFFVVWGGPNPYFWRIFFQDLSARSPKSMFYVFFIYFEGPLDTILAQMPVSYGNHRKTVGKPKKSKGTAWFWGAQDGHRRQAHSPSGYLVKHHFHPLNYEKPMCFCNFRKIAEVSAQGRVTKVTISLHIR